MRNDDSFGHAGRSGCVNDIDGIRVDYGPEPCQQLRVVINCPGRNGLLHKQQLIFGYVQSAQRTGM